MGRSDKADNLVIKLWKINNFLPNVTHGLQVVLTAFRVRRDIRCAMLLRDYTSYFLLVLLLLMLLVLPRMGESLASMDLWLTCPKTLYEYL